jgi:hypothetical protein
VAEEAVEAQTLGDWWCAHRDRPDRGEGILPESAGLLPSSTLNVSKSV